MTELQKTDKTVVRFYNKSGNVVTENIEAGSTLKFFYNNCMGKCIRPIVMNYYTAELYSYYQDSTWSIKDIDPFIKRHDIMMDDFLVPASGYSSFNHFFTRQLRPGARVIDETSTSIISPVDGKIFVINNIDEKISFFVKNEYFDLKKFLQSAELAKKFAGGTLIIARLAPYDYHRFHIPLNGFVESPLNIAGGLDSVNPVAYKAGVQPLLSNERHVLKINTQNAGTVLMISVGAAFVGRIKYTFPFDTLGVKGDEVGYFEFGGSTIVLLFQRNVIDARPDLVAHSLEGLETEVHMGEYIATVRGG